MSPTREQCLQAAAEVLAAAALRIALERANREENEAEQDEHNG